MICKCRFVKPNTSIWYNVEANSFEEAAQEFHGQFVPSTGDNNYSAVYRDRKPEGGLEHVYFSLVEIEGYGETVVRTYYSGISRLGAKSVDPTIESIAKAIDWEKNPKELLEYWTGEESSDRALKNKLEKKGLYKKSTMKPADELTYE
jgi:hypothetical protein